MYSEKDFTKLNICKKIPIAQISKQNIYATKKLLNWYRLSTLEYRYSRYIDYWYQTLQIQINRVVRAEDQVVVICHVYSLVFSESQAPVLLLWASGCLTRGYPPTLHTPSWSLDSGYVHQVHLHLLSRNSYICLIPCNNSSYLLSLTLLK